MTPQEFIAKWQRANLSGQSEHLPRDAMERAGRAVQLGTSVVVLWLVVLPFRLGLFW